MSNARDSLPSIRRAVPADAAGIAAVLGVIAAERIHSAIDRPWTVEEERRYLESLSPREAIHVAVDGVQGIVGLQILDLWSPVLASMAHVGQIGTFILPAMAVAGHKTEAIYHRYAIVDAGALREAAAKIDAANSVTGTITGTMTLNQQQLASAHSA